MPVTIKLVFSLVVLAVAFASYLFLGSIEQSLASYLALFLGVFSVMSFWIFPEVSHKKSAKDPSKT